MQFGRGISDLLKLTTIRIQWIFVFATASAANPSVTRKVVRVNGIEFNASPSVADEAIKRAEYIVDQMLANAPQIRERMRAAGFKVEIIGKNENLTDLPDFAFLKGQRTFDGRDFDTGTRGVGTSQACSIGEENLLCLSNQRYPAEDLLIHEFSHSIKFYMDPELSKTVDQAYENAIKSRSYPSSIYMMSNSQEYWAEGTQVWFNATLRSDVNDDFNSPDALRAHDPALTAAQEKIFGSSHIDHLPGCRY